MDTTAHAFPKLFSEYECSPVAEDGDAGVAVERQVSLMAKHRNLLALIVEWLDDETNTVFIGAALADDSDDCTGVSVGLETEDEQAHVVYFTFDELREVYPEVPSLGDFVYLAKRDDLVGGSEANVDQEQFSEALGFDSEALFNNSLCAPLLTPTQAIHYCLAYALSGKGEATVQKVSDEQREEFEGFDEEYGAAPLFSVGLSYSSEEDLPGGVPGFGEYVYFGPAEKAGPK